LTKSPPVWASQPGLYGC